MIIIGYQGIGKSTLAARNIKYIDLESSNFWFQDHETNKMLRHDNWYEMYCNIAEDLSRQGYIVFVSSHRPVRERLRKSEEYVIACMPSIKLKNQWINKLEHRYNISGLEKDYKAYKNAVNNFDNNITEIQNDGFDILEIHDMQYDLEQLIDGLVNKRSTYTKDQIKNAIENLKNWDNYEPFHKAVDLVKSMINNIE